MNQCGNVGVGTAGMRVIYAPGNTRLRDVTRQAKRCGCRCLWLLSSVQELHVGSDQIWWTVRVQVVQTNSYKPTILDNGLPARTDLPIPASYLLELFDDIHPFHNFPKHDVFPTDDWSAPDTDMYILSPG